MRRREPRQKKIAKYFCFSLALTGQLQSIYIFQERSPSNVISPTAIGGLPTPATARSTATFTPRTSRTTAKSGAVTSHTLIPRV